jgi:AraC family transcriptional regulator, regulatory protein of adaptative response / methylated-DNA-[protein]-cysteine methyltransferase
MSDYDRIATAIGYLSSRASSQPSLSEVAACVHLSPHHFQRLFSRWVGVSPKRFLQVLTLERAKALLRESSAPLLEVSEQLGLSSGSRLHDHFVEIEAVTPAQFRDFGQGVEIRYGEGESPFGRVFMASTARGICMLEFVKDGVGGEPPLERLRKQWPEAELVRDEQKVSAMIARVFAPMCEGAKPVRLLVRGTNFQVQVWRALLAIPPGTLTSYSAIAEAIGKPRAVRAVGTAVGANPVAFLIPCHRVIRQSGELGGYRGGLVRKQAMYSWEAARG